MATPDACPAATVQFHEASSQTWDLVVIGAGPAGSMAAREAARAGARVLLVDRASFPRPKVCGCCVNGAAIALLNEVGLGDLTTQQNARPLHGVRLASPGKAANIPLTQGVALSRERFDVALIQAAIQAGAAFLDATQALIGQATADGRLVILKSATSEQATAAMAIVVAGGLGCRVFAESAADKRSAALGSRVGAGTTLAHAPADYKSGIITMACNPHGYVGLVRLEDDRLDVAAALDADAIKRYGGVAALATKILEDAGLCIPESLANASWQGTGRLTQQRQQVALGRSFFIGDAAGYVEPFTGEGMAWALASGRAVVPILLDLLRDGNEIRAEQTWINSHRRLIVSRARLCRYVSRFLRYPRLVGMAIRILVHAPYLARPVVKSLNASFKNP